MTAQKLTGYAMMLGAIFYFIANGIITPLMPTTGPSADIFGSKEFLARLSFAAASVFCLLVGSIGIFMHQRHKTRWFGALAFGIAFIGSAGVFAHEWAQVFYLHELAIVAPEGLETLVDRDGINLYLIEAVGVLVSFMLGWFLLGISMLFARVFNPIGPSLMVGGFFAVPILAASLPDLWGFVIGNFIIAIGFLLIGRELSRSEQS